EREDLGYWRLRPMERGVEAGDLGQSRKLLGDRPDGREVVRLVQRRQRLELTQLLQHAIAYAYGARIKQASVHDAMAGGDDANVALVRLQPLDQEADPLGV